MSDKMPKLRDRVKAKHTINMTLPKNFNVQRISMPNIVQQPSKSPDFECKSATDTNQSVQPNMTFHNRHISTGAYDTLSNIQQNAIVQRSTQLKNLLNNAVTQSSATRRSSRLLLSHLNTLSYEPDIITINEEKQTYNVPVLHTEPLSPTRYTLDIEDELEIQRIIAENEFDTNDDNTDIEPMTPSVQTGVSTLYSQTQNSIQNTNVNPLSPIRSRSVTNQSNIQHNRMNSVKHSATYVKKLYDELKQKERDCKLAAQLGATLVEDNTQLSDTVDELQRVIEQQSTTFQSQIDTLQNELEQLRIHNMNLMQQATRVRSDSDATSTVLSTLGELLHTDILQNNSEHINQQYIATGDITTDINALYRKHTYEKRYIQSLVAALQEQIQSLTETNTKLQTKTTNIDVTALYTQIHELTANNTQLQQRIIDMKTELDTQYKQTLRQHTKHHNTVVEQLNSDVTTEKQRNTELTQQLLTMQVQYDNLIEQQQNELQELKFSNTKLNNSVHNVSTGVDIADSNDVATNTSIIDITDTVVAHNDTINNTVNNTIELQVTPIANKSIKHQHTPTLVNLQSMYDLLDRAKHILTDNTVLPTNITRNDIQQYTAMNTTQQSTDTTQFEQLQFVLQRPDTNLSLQEQAVLRHVYKLLHSQWLIALSLLPSSKSTYPPIWQLDSSTDQCTCCRVYFNVIRRRHHCRVCSSIYCNTCSLQRVDIQKYQYYNERVCNSCYLITQQMQYSLQ